MAIDLDLVLRAYAHGIFPMSDARDDPDTFWVEPKRRAILPLDKLHISKSLAKTIRQGRFDLTTNTAFAQVIATCAEEASDRQETWINAEIENTFIELHEKGFSHSVECWQGGVLVGGLYGLALGRAFFGESMFSRATDASKVALVWLVARLRMAGFELLDCQFMTDHLARLGVQEISQQDYLGLLDAALSEMDQVSAVCAEESSSSPDWGALDGFLESELGRGSSSPGKLILHSLTQMS